SHPLQMVSVGQHDIGSDLGQRLAKLALNALQRRVALALEAQYQYRCGVGGAAQAPAVGVVDANTVQGGLDAVVTEVALTGQALDQRELGLIGNRDIELRGAHVLRVALEES